MNFGACVRPGNADENVFALVILFVVLLVFLFFFVVVVRVSPLSPRSVQLGQQLEVIFADLEVGTRLLEERAKLRFAFQIDSIQA
jgi:hypothetical protein